ncbi:hypothetical protein HC248_03505 [Polaromonas vacuolata]|uniref:Uncharacterized protein n=1 Tax=Polaromonas vacuolata TaxID=37448 RepID=A0A6H2HE73_9BURK|nr:hypothetical protein HC248_03505 [Polaromonas vacuolata]
MHSSATAPDRSAQAAGIPFALLLLLAIGAGLSAACLYYSQPMLGELGAQFNVSPSAIGLVPTLTTLGYALGISSGNWSIGIRMALKSTAICASVCINTLVLMRICPCGTTKRWHRLP